MAEKEQEAKELQENIKILDILIQKKEEFLKLMKSKIGQDIFRDLDIQRASAFQDYMEDDTPLNRAMAKLWNFFYNYLVTLVNVSKTELENILNEKENFIEQLNTIRNLGAESEESMQRGGSV